MSFAHLHVHTEYSLLDGFSKIPHLVKRAKELEMPALAITDHGAMYGVIDFFNESMAQGIKPIIGMEGYISARGMTDRTTELDRKSSHLLLLAENQTGYQNLLKIASAAQLEGFYYKPRIDHDFLAAHSEGLIATSGCLSGEIPNAIRRENVDLAREKLDWYYEVFGKDRFFIEMQHHDIEELHAVNITLKELGERYQSNFIATNDVHYVNQSDARLQDILLCIQTGSLVSDAKRMRMSGESFYLRTPDEMQQLFGEIPGAMSNTLLIADRCEVDLTPKGYHLPFFEAPDGSSSKDYLRKLCDTGIEKRYGSKANDPEITERLEYELGIIDQMGFNAYFLIVWDLCRYAKEHAIWYNARGSAAGSIVAYTLEITLVDPMEHGLIFERFLNPSRVNMPDIDLDFQDDKRYRIMEYCTQRYGEDKVAAIITFGKLKARAAIRDVGRVLDVPLSDVDRVAKLIPNVPGNSFTIDQAKESVSDFKRAYKEQAFVRELVDTAHEMEGAIRNAGTHAAGVIITDRPVTDYIPLNRPTASAAEDSPIKSVTQFEMSTIDDLGLLKVDFLGLATLTVMERACQLINQRHDKNLHLGNIPTDDPETFELLGRGETAGVFQFEGAGMRRWMMEMKPKSLDNAVAMVALFRPGPMEFIPSYIKRMHGEEETKYSHPDLESIFGETYGIAVYQEQVMSAVMELANYSASEADDLRKAISKKIESKLEKHRVKFVQGSVAGGIDEQVAKGIFADWENFARYGFNKAHAADYGHIAVQTAYLKTHYPTEYMTASLSVAKNDTAKVAAYVSDCRNMGIEVLAPDFLHSNWDFTIQDHDDQQSTIRFGLGAIKNVGHDPVAAIMEGREKGKTDQLADLVKTVDFRRVGKRALESLIKVGALDTYGERHPILQIAEQIIAVSSSHFRAEESGQISLFSGKMQIEQEIQIPESVLHEDIARRELLTWERELIGLYVSDHPLKHIEDELAEIVTHFCDELPSAGAKERVRVAGLITHVRPLQTKRGHSMAIATLEDTRGEVGLVIFPKTWERYSDLVTYDRVLIVEGKLDPQEATVKILVDKIDTQLSITGPQKKQAKESSAEKVKPAVEPTLVSQTELAANIPSSEEEALSSNDPQSPDTFPDDWASTQESKAEPEKKVDDAPPEKKTDDVLDEAPVPVKQHNLSEPALLTSPEANDEYEREATKDDPADLEPQSTSPQNVQIPSASTTEADISPKVETQVPSITYIPPPQPAITSDDDDSPKMLTIVLRSSGDRTRDILHLRQVHGTLISYPGKDHFAFYVIEGSSGYLMEFPNDTTKYNSELKSRLEDKIGSENLRVESITYQ